MRISGVSFSVSGVMEVLRSLYEHDDGSALSKEVVPKDGEGKKAKPGVKKSAGRGKRKRESDYIEKEKEEAAEVDEKSEEYSSVMAPVGKDGEYAIKSGHEGRRLNEYAGKMPHSPPAMQSRSAEEPAGKFSKLYEARAVLDEIGGMLGGAEFGDARYLKELNEATVLGADSLRAAYGSDMVKIEYSDPVFINNQWTYQRIFMKNDAGGRSVYEFTVGKADSTGTEAKARYDDGFGTFYFESLNGVKDGHNDAYWEVWVNGNIVEEALDKTHLKKGDVVEWRLANERESFCGGGGGSDRRNEFETMYRNPLGAPSGYLPNSDGTGYMKPFGLHALPLNGSYGLR